MLNECDRQLGTSGSLMWSLGVSLDLGSVGPTNGARPVGLRTEIRNKNDPVMLSEAVRIINHTKCPIIKLYICN